MTRLFDAERDFARIAESLESHVVRKCVILYSNIHTLYLHRKEKRAYSARDRLIINEPEDAIVLYSSGASTFCLKSLLSYTSISFIAASKSASTSIPSAACASAMT